MTAEPMSPQRAGAATATGFGSSRRGVRRARMRLLRKMEEQSLWLAHHRLDLALIGTRPPGDTRNLECARAALNAYCARASLEELESALVRMDIGEYGVCELCRAPIPVEHLEMTPETKYCAHCEGGSP